MTSERIGDRDYYSQPSTHDDLGRVVVVCEYCGEPIDVAPGKKYSALEAAQGYHHPCAGGDEQHNYDDGLSEQHAEYRRIT